MSDPNQNRIKTVYIPKATGINVNSKRSVPSSQIQTTLTLNFALSKTVELDTS